MNLQGLRESRVVDDLVTCSGVPGTAPGTRAVILSRDLRSTQSLPRETARFTGIPFRPNPRTTLILPSFHLGAMVLGWVIDGMASQ